MSPGRILSNSLCTGVVSVFKNFPGNEIPKSIPVILFLLYILVARAASPFHRWREEKADCLNFSLSLGFTEFSFSFTLVVKGIRILIPKFLLRNRYFIGMALIDRFSQSFSN